MSDPDIRRATLDGIDRRIQAITDEDDFNIILPLMQSWIRDLALLRKD